MVAAGVGFASEAVHYRREKKRVEGEKLICQSQQPDDISTPEEVNHTIWALDDAEGEPAARETDSQSLKESSDLAKAFLERHPCQSNVNLGTKLALPVILVQRRPKQRARGFVRAYAPTLSDVGIDQETFVDFIDTFNKALEPNPYIYAINLAGFAELAVPDPLMMLFGVGVGIATDAIMELQSRFKSNKFLDSVNAEFFIPRGLICLVVTWRPDASNDELIAAVDFEGKAIKSHSETGLVEKIRDIATKKTPSGEGLRQIQEQMQDIMKPSNGVFNCAEPAPLVFPSLHGKAVASGGTGNDKKKNAVDRAEIWLDEYMDERAKAKWIEKSPELTMANMLPKPEFRSRYADPSHPAASGDIVAFLTGGNWQYGHGRLADSGSKASSQCEGDDETSKRPAQKANLRLLKAVAVRPEPVG